MPLSKLTQGQLYFTANQCVPTSRKIYPFEIFTRATPVSSLVCDELFCYFSQGFNRCGRVGPELAEVCGSAGVHERD